MYKKGGKNMDDLLKAATSSDKDAFIKLMSKIEKELYYIASSKLSSKEDIQDVIQETIMSGYKNIKKVKDFSKFKAWIITILINNCNDIYRKKNKKIVFSYNQNDIESDLICDEMQSSSYDAINDKIDFNFLLNKLTEEERIIFTLFYGSKYSIKDISQILKLNENTIKSKLKRAREKVKLFIERCDKNEGRF